MNGKKKEEVVTHTVRVGVDEEGGLTYEPCCVHACPGERITWESDGAHPFAVIIEAFEGPLDRHWLAARPRERSISMTVRADAKPGFYPYSLVLSTRGGLLVADPEIIVPPPDRRGR